MWHNVHIVPLGLDYDRIVRGIEAYGAHKIYVLRGKPHAIETAVDPYFERLKEHYEILVKDKMFKEIRMDIFSLADVCSKVYKIMEEEKQNRLYFSLSSSTKLLSAFVLFAAWSKGDEMKHPPVIYYVNPARYVHIEFTHLADKADDLLSRIDSMLSKDELERIKEFVTKVRDIATAAKKGLAIGEEGKGHPYEVPFIPVKKPSKIGIEVLKLLYKNKGRFDSVDKLARVYLTEVSQLRPYQIDEVMNATRSNLFNYLKTLESLNMIKKERKGRRTVIASTDLGMIFGRAFSH